jgi:hypothetical protein
MDRGSRI